MMTIVMVWLLYLVSLAQPKLTKLASVLCVFVCVGKLDDDNDDEDVEEEDAILELKQITHKGSVNRIRVSDWLRFGFITDLFSHFCLQAMPQRPHIVCTMSENCRAYIYDISKHLRALDSSTAGKLKSVAPLQESSAHNAEGFGLAWNPGAEGVYVPPGTIVYITTLKGIWQ